MIFTYNPECITRFHQ